MQGQLKFDFTHQVVVVTGGASGIGATIVEEFRAAGATAVIFDRTLDETAEAPGVICDVSDADSVNVAVDTVLAEHGRIDALVNCAGVARLAPAEDLSAADWDLTMDVNVKGTYLVCQSVGRAMLAAGSGRIVNISSQAGTVAIPEHLAYCASKFAVNGLSKVLAQEWGGRGVNVNTVSPTVVLTDLGRKAWAGPKGDAHKAQIPKGRFAEPAEVAAAVLFLCTNEADMINGADLLVDGGFTIG